MTLEHLSIYFISLSLLLAPLFITFRWILITSISLGKKLTEWMRNFTWASYHQNGWCYSLNHVGRNRKKLATENAQSNCYSLGSHCDDWWVNPTIFTDIQFLFFFTFKYFLANLGIPAALSHGVVNYPYNDRNYTACLFLSEQGYNIVAFQVNICFKHFRFVFQSAEYKPNEFDTCERNGKLLIWR